jgi:hypothetical protein
VIPCSKAPAAAAAQQQPEAGSQGGLHSRRQAGWLQHHCVRQPHRHAGPIQVTKTAFGDAVMTAAMTAVWSGADLLVRCLIMLHGCREIAGGDVRISGWLGGAHAGDEAWAASAPADVAGAGSALHNRRYSNVLLHLSCHSLSGRLLWHRLLTTHYLAGCRALWVRRDGARRPAECIRLAHSCWCAAAAATGPRQRLIHPSAGRVRGPLSLVVRSAKWSARTLLIHLVTG